MRKRIGGYFTQFRSYYMWQTIAIVCILIFVVLSIREMTGKKETALSMAVLNANNGEHTCEQIQREFLDVLGLDQEAYAVDVELFSQTPGIMLDEYDLAASEKIAAGVNAKILDLLLADASNFEHYAKSGACADLHTVLEEDCLESCKDRIYYIDLAEVEHEKADEDEESMFHTLNMDAEQAKLQEKKANFQLPDPDKMAEPCAVGVVLSDTRFIRDYGLYSDTVCIIGFARNSTRTKQAATVFEYILE